MPEKALILFHSVCGNTYLLARQYTDTLRDLGLAADLYRLHDPNYDKFAPMFAASRQYQAAISAVPELPSSMLALDYDWLFLGSPTYFGNVSTAVKGFMDGCCDFWIDARLAGKKFGCFTSSATDQGGSAMCLQAMNTFAMHMGMTLLSVPANLPGPAQPAYGIAHAAGGDSLTRPREGVNLTIANYLLRAVGQR